MPSPNVRLFPRELNLNRARRVCNPQVSPAQKMSDPRIYDCCLYNGEQAALEIRLHELAPVVDFFVVVEATRTHRGVLKEPHLNVLDPRFSPFAKKIRHVVVSDTPQTTDPRDRERRKRNASIRG